MQAEKLNYKAGSGVGKIRLYIGIVLWYLAGVTVVPSIITFMPETVYAQQPAQVIRFNILAMPLAGALRIFSEQSGYQVLFSEPAVAGRTSPAINESLTPRAALDKLLTGTQIIVVDTVPGAFTLQAPSGPDASAPTTLPPLTVSTASLKQGTAEEGYRVSNVSGVGLWDERSLRDTPYSISVVPSDLIENINAQNMGQIFKMNPLTQEPNIQNNNGVPLVTIRGFQSDNPVYDGIPIAATNGSAVSVIEIDRVEILSGTSGFLYGGNRVGGAINYVT